MLEKIETFFDAWAVTDEEQRMKMISSTVALSVKYDDPRTQETLEGVQTLCDYVGMFSANAPGWSAKVIKEDTIGGMTRVTIAFGGTGPDGKEMLQHGQYFVEMEGELISRMVGFVGTGE